MMMTNKTTIIKTSSPNKEELEAINILAKQLPLNRFLSRIDTSRNIYYIMYVYGDVLGVASTYKNKLTAITINKDYQRQGLGEELLAFVKKDLLKKYKRVVVYCDNSVRPFFQKHGEGLKIYSRNSITRWIKRLTQTSLILLAVYLGTQIKWI